MGDPLTRLLAPAPVARLGLLRVLVGTYALGWLLVRMPHLWETTRFDDARFDPVGPLWFLDTPPTPGLNQSMLVAAVALGVAFTAGWRFRVTGTAFALAFLAVTTYRNSWGQVFHTDNLVALHLSVLALAPAAASFSFDRRRQRLALAGDAPDEPEPSYRFGLPVRLCSIVTVLAYAIAGWAKLRNSGLDWITGDTLQNQVAHDNLRKALFDDQYSPIAGVALRHGWIFPPFAAMSVVVELAAPLALVARNRLRMLWIVAAWFFHAGVLALMAIGFPYQLSGVGFASMLRLERLPGWARARRSAWFGAEDRHEADHLAGIATQVVGERQ